MEHADPIASTGSLERWACCGGVNEYGEIPLVVSSRGIYLLLSNWVNTVNKLFELILISSPTQVGVPVEMKGSVLMRLVFVLKLDRRFLSSASSRFSQRMVLFYFVLRDSSVFHGGIVGLNPLVSTGE